MLAVNQLLNNVEPKIVKTDDGSKDGQNKCPQCGATDISVNAKTGRLRCNFCRHEFEPQKVQGMETDISKLEGEIIGSGAQAISNDSGDVITLKCSSCGAEVVIHMLIFQDRENMKLEDTLRETTIIIHTIMMLICMKLSVNLI